MGRSNKDELQRQIRLQQYWNKPSAYVPPKIKVVTDEEMTLQNYIDSMTSFEILEGGRQIPNRKPSC